MDGFNRLVAILLWLALLALVCVAVAAPLTSAGWTQTQLTTLEQWLAGQQADHPTNFLIAQFGAGVVGVLLFGLLIVLELWSLRRRGVRIRTAQGGSAELDTVSISRRLAWHLDQLAEVISVMPTVKSKGGSVDIRLEIETAPDIDVPMKTDEVVDVTREVVEQDMGLKLGKLDVRMRYAPFEGE